ncbi:MAG: hypothetical protein EBT05_02195 [Betaproteobacteria bacterium]|nr:hypothetical protein [Betaproteobacteria bacterium]
MVPRAGLAVARHWQAAQHFDAVALQQLGPQRLQVAGERPQWKISRADLTHVAAQREVMPCSLLQLGNLLGRQAVQPAILMPGHVVAEPGGGADQSVGQM